MQERRLRNTEFIAALTLKQGYAGRKAGGASAAHPSLRPANACKNASCLGGYPFVCMEHALRQLAGLHMLCAQVTTAAEGMFTCALPRSSSATQALC